MKNCKERRNKKIFKKNNKKKYIKTAVLNYHIKTSNKYDMN